MSRIEDDAMEICDGCGELMMSCTCVDPETCDHEWETIDQSYDHEYGTETIIFDQCILCGEERDHDQPYFGDEVL